MSIEWVEGQLRQMGDDTLADSAANLRRLVTERHGIADIPLPESTQVFPLHDEESLSLAIQTYKEAWDTNTLTPELVTQTWQAFWGAKTKNIHLKSPLQIPSCDRTAEELAVLKRDNRGVILLPDEIMKPEGIEILVDMFPAIGRGVLRKNLHNVHEEGGCLDTEMESMTPYRGNNVSVLQRQLLREDGQRVQTYIVASQFNNLLTGKPFVGKTSLFGSRLGPSIATVMLQSDGTLRLREGHTQGEGYRTEKRKASL